MNVDLERWNRLVAEIESLSAHARGLNARWNELQERRNTAARELALVETERARRYGPRPPQGETLESARQKVREADAQLADSGTRRQIEADADLRWFETKGVLDEIDAQMQRLEHHEGEVTARLGPLRRLRQAVEQYATANAIALPGVDASRVSAPGRIVQMSGAAPTPAAGATPAAAASAR